MNAGDPDPVLRQLSRLAAADPDPIWTARVRSECHAALRFRQHKQDFRRRAVETVLVGGFSLIYFLGIVIMVLRW